MKRDILKAIDEGKLLRRKKPAIDLEVSETLSIQELCKNSGVDMVIDAIVLAYSAGLSVGYRNGKKA